MLCNVLCIFRCKVLVSSRYCTVDGTFLCLLYVSNVQKKKVYRQVYLLFLTYVYTYLYIVNVLITKHAVLGISVTLGEKKTLPSFYIQMCCVYRCTFSSIFHTYMLIYGLGELEKAEILFVCLEFNISWHVEISWEAFDVLESGSMQLF